MAYKPKVFTVYIKKNSQQFMKLRVKNFRNLYAWLDKNEPTGVTVMFGMMADRWATSLKTIGLSDHTRFNIYLEPFIKISRWCVNVGKFSHKYFVKTFGIEIKFLILVVER